MEVKDYTGEFIITNYGDNVKILGFDKSKTHDRCWFYHCPNCGSMVSNPIYLIKKRKGCCHCKNTISSISNKLNTYDFIKKLKDVQPNLSVIGEYTKRSCKIKVRCDIHNIEFERVASNLLSSKNSCPICKSENKSDRKYSIEFVVKTIDDLGWIMLDESEYKNSGSVLTLKCKKCGHIRKLNFKHLLDGRRCSVCAGLSKRSTDDFKREVYDLVGDEYTVLGEYVNLKEKILIRHNVCGLEYEVIPNNFIHHNRRCPNCSRSHGEDKIRNVLDNFEIDFVSQKKFDDLVGIGGGLLSYDFYLPHYNLLIE